MTKTRKSTEFEKLVALILEELSPHAQVKWDDHIYGHDTGIDRQIDVSIRATLAGTEILTIVQAKNWKQRADINTVGEFASVVRDVRATKGILVCKSGFSETTKNYAKNLGIELLNIHDAQSRDWNLEMRIPIIWIEEEPQGGLAITYTHDKVHDLPINEYHLPILSNDSGKSIVELWAVMKERWNSGNLPRTPNILHTAILPKTLSILVIDNGDQWSWIPVDTAKIEYQVTRKVWLGSVKPEECRGIFNYLTGAFTASYLPMGQMPTQPQADWYLLENPNELIVEVKSAPVITRNWIIQFDTQSATLDGNEIFDEKSDEQIVNSTEST
jgi:hypothetical protein